MQWIGEKHTNFLDKPCLLACLQNLSGIPGDVLEGGLEPGVVGYRVVWAVAAAAPLVQYLHDSCCHLVLQAFELWIMDRTDWGDLEVWRDTVAVLLDQGSAPLTHQVLDQLVNLQGQGDNYDI